MIRRSPSNYQRQHVWGIEQTFRTAKHLFSTRPIFHKLDETIRGHVFCSFLALVLKTTLEDRIAALGRSGSWPDIIADLDSLTETEIEYDGKRFIVRSAPSATQLPDPRPIENVVPRRRSGANSRRRSETAGSKMKCTSVEHSLEARDGQGIQAVRD